MSPKDGLRDFLLKLETHAKIPVFSSLLRVVRGRRIYVGGMECTGSTFVYQLVRAMGLRVFKVHTYVLGRFEKIVTYRDPRDVICSYARRQLRSVTESKGIEQGLIESHLRLFRQHKRHEDLRRYVHDPYTLLLRYEEYLVGREAALLDNLIAYLKVSVPMDVRKQMIEEYSLRRNKQRARRFPSFSHFDRDLQIHGGHVSSDGRSGVWRELFTSRVRELVKEDLGQFLVEFGYESNLNW